MQSQQIRFEVEESQSLLAFYNRANHTFQYHQDLLAYLGNELSGKLLWNYLEETGSLPHEEAQQIQQICETLDETNSFFAKYFRPAGMSLHSFIFSLCGETITIALKDLTPDIAHTESRMCDELTGLLSRAAYCAKLDEIIPQERNRSYAVFFFDVVKFKAINDLFGFAEGDKLLQYIASKLDSFFPRILAACRMSADRFSFLADVTQESPESVIHDILNEIEQYPLTVSISCNVGIYLVSDPDESSQSMLDKATLAQAAVKGNYAQKINYYTSELRDQMLNDQEILGNMNSALEHEQFVVYYQPQYNHSTGMIVGAEALIRWMHPEKGLISPSNFIPLFEKNGFITKLDQYVFEQACRFLRNAMEQGYAMVPISINFSINDIYLPDFVDQLETIRNRYGIPSEFLRIELTERIRIGTSKEVNAVFQKLHACGYVIEIDDFGSGYSSLNVLKDLEFDIIKLDMLFLDHQNHNRRGGIILSSVVHMAKWLKMPIIAEGVETIEQADFLRSIGCDYMQGYLYSRPLPEDEYIKLLSASHIETMTHQVNLIENMNFANFWDPESQETLIFNNFSGPASIFRYDRTNRSMELLRVNQKFMQELGMNLSEREIIYNHQADFATNQERDSFFKILDLAIATQEEQEGETWQHIRSSYCGETTICVRHNVRVIGNSGDLFLFYGMIRNVTSEK